ncbi:GNAT family N-acetyltransferase [Kaarinaea lacus]
MKIRVEQEEDYKDIKALNDLAFEGVVEGEIVDNIRSSGAEIISLVAVEGDKIIGHIFFSPVTVVSGDTEIKGMALGPMAVLPGFQKQGIGSALIKEGIEILKNKGCPFVIVLGHEDYYPRFGFEVASNYGLYPEWEGIPDEAFMVLFLNKDVAGKVSGQVRYRIEFNEAV